MDPRVKPEGDDWGVGEAWELAVVSENLLVISDKEESRYVPVRIARPLLEECGYRCSVPRCKGTSALQLEHIEDWAKLDFKKHTFDKMIVLCATCHARVTSKEIHKDSIRGYKRNLAVVNGRYSLFEIRLLEKFHENTTTQKSAEFFVLDTEADKDIKSIVELGSELISKTDYLHIKGLLDDGILNCKVMPTVASFGGVEMAPMQVSLTDSGNKFLTDYFSGNVVD